MAAAGTIGMLALFGVDLILLLWLLLIGDSSVTAALGFSGVVSLTQTSFSIGIAVASVAVVGRAIGAGRLEDARRLATVSLLLAVSISTVLALVTFVFRGQFVAALGAVGREGELASKFLAIGAFSSIPLTCGMTASNLLRAAGSPKHSMYCTLSSAASGIILDPLLIFGFGLGLRGAAIAVLVSRTVFCVCAIYWAHRPHRLFGKVDGGKLWADVVGLRAIAMPAVMASLAMPFADAVVTHTMASFGPAAVSAQAAIARIAPLAFCAIYSLNGSISPVMAQNRGAGFQDRIRATIFSAVTVCAIAVAVPWAILIAFAGPISRALGGTEEAAELVAFYCHWTAGSFFFIGSLHIANATFNSVGRPLIAAGFNWARATVGTVPLVLLASSHGPEAVQVAQAAGTAIFGIGALAAAIWLTPASRESKWTRQGVLLFAGRLQRWVMISLFGRVRFTGVVGVESSEVTIEVEA